LINLYDPHSYQYTGSGKSVPLEKERGTIFAQVQVKAPGRPPVPARLLVDLPASWAITLNQQFAEKHQLMPPTDKLKVTNECGGAGWAKGVSFEGKLEALQLGGFKLSDPLTFFRHTPVGGGYDGLLGGPALRNFKVILDYSRSRMILEPPR
jgi:hypothetical protein